MTQNDPGNDYPLSEVPRHARKGLASTAMVLLGFTFFTATMFAGGKLGVAFSFSEMLGVIVLGNLLLGIYAAGLGYIAFKSGLNSVLMGRFCFGEIGSKLSDLILGFTQIGWYAWGTATAAVVLGKYFELSQGTVLALMVLFGMVFCATAYIGYRGLEILSYIAVPTMALLLMLSMWVATVKVGGLDGLLAVVPTASLDLSTAITLVFGTFVGTLLALLGMYDMLVPYLILLGTVIPPIGGVIMADFFFRYRGRYPRLAEAQLPAFNWPGLTAYAVGTVAAFSSPWVAPLVGIAAAALTYIVLTGLLGARTSMPIDAQTQD